MSTSVSTPVYREYDQAALDAQYDNRGKVPNYDEYLARYVRRSEETRAELECRLAVPYGSHAWENLDIFPGGGAGNSPIHLFIHGGYWTRLSKDEFSFVANATRGTGTATVVINYALIPGVDMAELVRQCRAALAWTWLNAASFGGDSQRLHISGHSAGGHLVAMLMATDWQAFDSRLPAQPIHSVLGFSGLYDLEPIRLSYLNDGLHLAAEQAAAFSPVRLARHCHCPVTLAVGDLEGPEYLRQSRALAEAWSGSASGPVPEVQVASESNHFSIVEQLDDPGSPMSKMLRAQFAASS